MEIARATLLAEADAIRIAAERLDGKIAEAVDLILASRGKVVVTGMGKSGHIGQKIAATLCSTGTPSVFLHAAEATHGDLGIYEPGDPTILISKSGATAELVHLIPVLRQFRTPLIGILGNLSSPIAQKVDVALDGRVAREADPLNLAPTSSSTVALALGTPWPPRSCTHAGSAMRILPVFIPRGSSAGTCPSWFPISCIPGRRLRG